MAPILEHNVSTWTHIEHPGPANYHPITMSLYPQAHVHPYGWLQRNNWNYATYPHRFVSHQLHNALIRVGSHLIQDNVRHVLEICFISSFHFQLQYNINSVCSMICQQIVVKKKKKCVQVLTEVVIKWHRPSWQNNAYPPRVTFQQTPYWLYLIIPPACEPISCISLPVPTNHSQVLNLSWIGHWQYWPAGG